MGTMHPWKRRVFVDTEFTTLESPLLISIAAVAEDGDEFYVELNDFPIHECSDFVRSVVLPQLGKYPDRVMSRESAASELDNWMNELKRHRERPVVCYDHPVDIELLTRLIGARPSGWQFQNISSRIDQNKRDQHLDRSGGRHHALFDARANCAAFR